MSIFVWSEQFSIGIAALDAQHRKLLELIEELGSSRGVASETEAATQAARVRDYVHYHFDFEEAAWEARGVAAEVRAQHARNHRHFREQVERAWALDVPLERRVEQLQDFLVSWLLAHIVGEDRALAKASGATLPASAESGSAEVVLLSVMRNLYRKLASKNADLAAAKERLEELVAERTASLVRANEALANEREVLLKMITQLDEARLQLLQAEHLASLGKLAAGVAHEVNNPLAIVAANVASIGHETEDLLRALGQQEAAVAAGLPQRYQAVASMVSDARVGLARIKEIVNSLRAFTRTGAKGWQYADLNQGLDHTLVMLTHELGERITVVRELGALDLVFGEHGQLNQVFFQLLRNAHQAIAGEGRITVRTRSDGEFAVVEVTDTGRGMSAEELARACEPFFTTRQVGTGMGLGLSMAWSTVRQHGGHLSLHSRHGEGTTATVRLPLGGPPTSAAAPEPRPAA